MARNRSFGLVVLLGALAVITVIFGTGVATPPASVSGMGSSVAVKAPPADFAALKESQLGQRDGTQFGNTSSIIATEDESSYAMQKEQLAARGSAQSALHAAAATGHSDRYAGLKDAQLEREDARIKLSPISIIVPPSDRCRPHRDVVDC